MKPSPMHGPAWYFLSMLAIIAGMLLALPWIVTGMQHYYTWVFQTTGFH